MNETYCGRAVYTYDSINAASVSQGHVFNVCLWEEAVLSSKMSDEICGLLVLKPLSCSQAFHYLSETVAS